MSNLQKLPQGNSPVSQFDAIVIGSGYGGSVSAYRLAQAGLKVAVLEAGYSHKAPDIPRGEASEWNPTKGRFGPHTITRLNSAVTAWTGTALGGGSIVNAAVMIRKDNFENWPGGISRPALDPYYDRVERMLGATVYPVHFLQSPYSNTVKSKVMLNAAAKLGVPSVMPPVAITYRQPGETVGTVKLNQFGAAQQGCRQCGECSLPGCNYQAKNSLDFNYLFGARAQYGAEILPGNKVDKIEPVEGGYVVTAIDPKSGESRIYRAKVVVVAAGCVGSSELLLRQKHLHKTLPLLSNRLGQQYTSNGTFIGFAVRSKSDLDPSGGPEITAGLDFKGEDGKSQGHLMFDGSFRGFSYDTFYITGRLLGLRKWAIKLLSAAFAVAEKTGVVEPKTTLPLLVIGRDNAVGAFTLNKSGRIQTDLNPQDNASFYKRANQHMRAFTRTIGARFLPFPHWSLQSKIDVPHNLGGVPMGESAVDGVVDDKGRVFGYENLMVLDGSIVPATMGANPALTIAALAERSMEEIVENFKMHKNTRATIPATGGDSAANQLPPSRDLTAAFVNLYDDVAQSRLAGRSVPLPAGLTGKKILWTQGILAKHKKAHSRHIMARFAALGLAPTLVPVDTDVATAANIELIKSHIKSMEEGQCILSGHSRGGNMSLDAYRQLSDEDKAKVSRIILIQAPVNGSYVADFLMSSAILRRVTAATSRVLFGNNLIDTIGELSTHGRRVAQRALPALSASDLAKIITVRTSIAPRENYRYEVPRAINHYYGHASDGLTPYDLSEIVGAGNVCLTSYHHEDYVMQEPPFFSKNKAAYIPLNKRFEAGDTAEALLRLAFS